MLSFSARSEKLLVLAIDRWHPAAKIAEATNRPDLLESAVAINGAPSTAEFVLRYGPITFDWRKREYRSLNRPDLAPLELLKPLFGKPDEFQHAAVRYILSQIKDGVAPSTDSSSHENKEFLEMAQSWLEFQKQMEACYVLMNMPLALRLQSIEASPIALLGSVVQETFVAARSDFMSRLFHALLTNPKVMSGIAVRPGEGEVRGEVFQASISGEQYDLEFISPEVIAMLGSLYPDSPQPSPIQQVLRFAVAVKTLLTVGITATPEFAIKNGIRDMLSAFALGKDPQAPWKMITGARHEVMRSEIAKDWMLQGGSFSSFYDHVLEADPSEGGRFALSLVGGSSLLKKRLKKVWSIYTVPFRALEAGSRIAQYSRVLSSGASKRQAMIQSRQISTDFADRGASQLWWTYCRTVPFLNASLQGMNQLRKVFFTVGGTGGETHGVRSVLHRSLHARHSAFRAFMLMAIPLLALAWNLSNDARKDQYQAQAAFDKANYVYLYDVGGVDYRIPVPFELGAIFMKLPELVADRLFDVPTVDTETLYLGPSDLVPPTVWSLVDSTFLLTFTPALIQPAYHVMRNRDFLDRIIEPYYMKDWPVANRHFSSTPIVLRGIAKILPIFSPLQLKVLFEGYLGHMARLFFYGTDELLWSEAKYGAMPFPQFWYRASGLRAFVRYGPITYSRYSINLKRLNNAADAAHASCRMFRENCSKYRDLISIRSRTKSIDTGIKKVRRTVRRIYTAKNMSLEFKEKRIEELYEIIHKRAKRGFELGVKQLDS